MRKACVKAVNSAWKSLWIEFGLYPLPTAPPKCLTSQAIIAHNFGTVFGRLHTINSQPSLAISYLLGGWFSLFSTVSITNTNLINKGFVL